MEKFAHSRLSFMKASGLSISKEPWLAVAQNKRAHMFFIYSYNLEVHVVLCHALLKKN